MATQAPTSAGSSESIMQAVEGACPARAVAFAGGIAIGID